VVRLGEPAPIAEVIRLSRVLSFVGNIGIPLLRCFEVVTLLGLDTTKSANRSHADLTPTHSPSELQVAARAGGYRDRSVSRLVPRLQPSHSVTAVKSAFDTKILPARCLPGISRHAGS
jgi:hypothetical protein